MDFEDIKISNIEKTSIEESDQDKDFYRIIFKYSVNYPPEEWVKIFSKKYNSIKSQERKIESWEYSVIVHCRLNELPTILDDLKKASMATNEEYKKYLNERQKVEEELERKSKKEREMIDKTIDELKFD